VLHYAAFTRDSDGGNHAGVILDATKWSDEDIQYAAAAVGHSETAFVIGDAGDRLEVRYVSPVSEVAFCGHATIALAVALAEQRGPSDRTLLMRSWAVTVQTIHVAYDQLLATLTSVTPRVTEPDPRDLQEAIDALRWSLSNFQPNLPPRVSFAGASHLILVAANLECLAQSEYDFQRLKAPLDRAGWIAVHLAWPRMLQKEHIVRNAFPAGLVREESATGAATAVYGACLRRFAAVKPPVWLRLWQGERLGRPSILLVDIPDGDAGIRVSDNAVPLSGR